MSRWFLAFTLLLSLPAAAGQTAYQVEKGNNIWHFEVAWKDQDGVKHQINYALPARLVEQDMEEPLRFHPHDAAKYVAKEVNEWAASQRGVQVKAKINEQDGVEITGAGQDEQKLQEAMAGAEAVRDVAMEEYLVNHDFIEFEGLIIPDHAGHVIEYSDDLSTLVQALGGPTEDPRTFADLALSFVQSIPYEQRAQISDRYRRPLSLLGRNQGDCDSKAVLYLALMHNAYPELPLALVYIKDHAYAALGLTPADGDRTFELDGQTWVSVEPVGPALSEVGELSRYSRRQSRFDRKKVRVVGEE